MKRKRKKLISLLSVLVFISCLSFFWIDNHVKSEGARYIVSAEDTPRADAILVLGAKVFPDGRVSAILGDRLAVALELHARKKAPKLLVSGDHGQVNYDEVNTMKEYMLRENVKSEDVFMDHAGFSTYESIYRAKEIFGVKKVIIVTQEYHLMRALYLARQMGLDAYGVASDLQPYANMKQFKTREMAARFKDFIFVNILKPKPTYLGEAIPITGDGRLTDDKIQQKKS